MAQLGVLVYTRYLSPEERLALPASVDEARDLARWIGCDFSCTLAQLQQLVLRDMQRKGMDAQVDACLYAVVHCGCRLGSVVSRDGCNCNRRSSPHERILRTGGQSPELTLTELGMQPGHHAYVVLESPASGLSLAGLSLA